MEIHKGDLGGLLNYRKASLRSKTELKYGFFHADFSDIRPDE